MRYGSGMLGNHSREQIKIGEKLKLSGWLIIENDGKIEIGDYTTINERTIIRSMQSIKIGSHCMISSDVYIHDNNSHSTDWRIRRNDIMAAPEYGGNGQFVLKDRDV